MEINGFNSSYMDNFRTSSAATVDRTYGSSAPDFNEIFERAVTNQKKDSLSGDFSPNSAANAAVYSSKQPIDKTDKLYELCLELETFVVKNLISSMRNTVEKSGLIDDSFAGKMYEDMLYDEYAKDFTRNVNFGLAEQAYRQLSRLN